jgi:hypothetical protein
VAPIPEPRPGIVFRYRFLRIWQYQRGEWVGKDRPCLILAELKPGQVIGGALVLDEAGPPAVGQHTASSGDIMILPIQTDPPGADQAGLELTIDDKRHIGLPAQAPSYVIVSEINIDTWPNSDMSLIPGRTDALAYDRPIPGPLLARIIRAFLRVHAARRLRILVRRP